MNSDNVRYRLYNIANSNFTWKHRLFLLLRIFPCPPRFTVFKHVLGTYSDKQYKVNTYSSCNLSRRLISNNKVILADSAFPSQKPESTHLLYCLHIVVYVCTAFPSWMFSTALSCNLNKYMHKCTLHPVFYSIIGWKRLYMFMLYVLVHALNFSDACTRVSNI